MCDSEEICCLCLSTSNSPFNKLFSKIGNNSTCFDKISISLSQLAHVLHEIGSYDYLICKKCCNTIEMIYNFNQTSLENVRSFSSRFTKVKTESTISNKCKVTNVKSTSAKQREESHVKNASFLNNDKTIPLVEEGTSIKEECINTNDEMSMENSHQEDISQEEKNMDKATDGHFLTRSIDFENDEDSTKQSFIQNKNCHTENKVYTCNICNKTFGYKSSLNAHIKTHTSDKPYMCDICGKSFHHKSNLTAHMFTHTGQKPYGCNECKKSFGTKQNLECHKMIHSGEKPYLCDQCDKQFRQNSDLVKHKRIHSGEKPYTCNLCDRAFTSGSLLNRHKIDHTGERPFSCEYCSQSFKRKTHLIRHIATHKL